MKIKDIAFTGISEFPRAEITKMRRGRGTLVVHESTSGVRVATAVDALARDAGVVLLVDDADKPTGLFVPEDFRRELRARKNIVTGTLRDAIEELQSDPEEIAAGFHHEWLNSRRPKVKWCDACKVWALEPCPNH